MCPLPKFIYREFLKIYVFVPIDIQSVEDILNVFIREIVSEGFQEENNLIKIETITTIAVNQREQFL